MEPTPMQGHRCKDIPSLSGAHFEGAHLEGAWVRGVRLDGAHFEGAHLDGAHFEGVHLEGAHFEGAHLKLARLDGAILTGATLTGARLFGAMLRGARLDGAHLDGAMLTRANLDGAILTGACLDGAFLDGARLTGARLDGARLEGTRLDGAILDGAVFDGAILDGVILTGAILDGTILGGASCSDMIFTDVDLSQVEGLDSIRHLGPSSVSTSTLILSRGRIPEAFLRGCGLAPWEVLSTNLYDPALSPPRFAELQYRIFDAWTKGRGMMTGCFVSYSHADARFVDKLHDRLVDEGVNVWLDRHDMVAGTLQNQVWRAIQLHHVVVLVLSENSVKSDWVENELDMARRKEQAEGRAVLCPVALDDAWKAKVEAKCGPGDPNRKLWLPLTQKFVVDFSRWKTKAFEQAFAKLLRGLKVNYVPDDPPAAS